MQRWIDSGRGPIHAPSVGGGSLIAEPWPAAALIVVPLSSDDSASPGREGVRGVHVFIRKLVDAGKEGRIRGGVRSALRATSSQRRDTGNSRASTLLPTPQT